MDLQLTGTVKVIMDTQTFDSGFSKREFVITTKSEYPQDVKFEFFKDKTTILDKYKVGEDVSVSFNINGNEYNGKYYVSLQAWKMIKEGSSNELPTETVTIDDNDDNLPF